MTANYRTIDYDAARKQNAAIAAENSRRAEKGLRAKRNRAIYRQEKLL